MASTSDLLQERLIPLVAVPNHLPSGPGFRKIHVNTAIRWANPRRNGVVLESLKIGGRRFTSLEALERFVEALNAPVVQPGTQQPVRSPSRREREAERAGAALERLGV